MLLFVGLCILDMKVGKLLLETSKFAASRFPRNSRLARIWAKVLLAMVPLPLIYWCASSDESTHNVQAGIQTVGIEALLGRKPNVESVALSFFIGRLKDHRVSY